MCSCSFRRESELFVLWKEESFVGDCGESDSVRVD